MFKKQSIMRANYTSHAAKVQKKTTRECVKLCGDALNLQLPLFVMFLQTEDDHTCLSGFRRYRTAKLIRKIRKLASTAVDDSPNRFWLLQPRDCARLQATHKTTIERTCKSFNLEDTDDYLRCRSYCEQYVHVEFHERSTVHLQLYKKLRIKHAFLYVPLEIYNQVWNQVQVLMYIQVFEALGAKRIIYKKQTKSDVDELVSGGVQVKGVDLTIERGTHSMSNLATSREMTYEKNTDFTFHIKQVLDTLHAHPRCYFNTDEYYGDVELQYVLHSRVKEFMTNYSRFFHCTRAVSSELKMQLCIADLHHNFDLHANIQQSDTQDDVIYVHVEFYTVAELCDANDVPTNLAGFSLLSRMIASDVTDTDFLNNNTKSFYVRFVKEHGGALMFTRHQSRVNTDESYLQQYNAIQSFYDVRMLFELLHSTEKWAGTRFVSLN
jgi:hypothetical protein